MIRARGFSLTELLVVVSIIAVLSSVIVVSLNEYRVRAEAGALVQELGALETALRSYRQFELPGGWPVVSGTNNLASILNGTNTDFPDFEEYFNGQDSTLLQYESAYVFDGTAAADCGTSRGIHIRLDDAAITQARIDAMFEHMENAIDGTVDANCGKLRQQGGDDALYYIVAESRFAN